MDSDLLFRRVSSVLLSITDDCEKDFDDICPEIFHPARNPTILSISSTNLWRISCCFKGFGNFFAPKY